MREIAVFGGSEVREGSSDWDLARNVGQLAAKHGFRVVSGGYTGVMEAASKGAKEQGGEAKGIILHKYEGRQPNIYLTESEATNDMQERLAALLRVPVAVALPGKIGTYAEVIGSLDGLRRNEGRKLALHEKTWMKPVRAILDSNTITEDLFDSIFWYNKADELSRFLWNVDLAAENGPES